MESNLVKGRSESKHGQLRLICRLGAIPGAAECERPEVAPLVGLFQSKVHVGACACVYM